MKKAIIFDIDDTLLDTTKYLTEKGLLNGIKAMVKAGLPLSYKDAIAYKGKLMRKEGTHVKVIPTMVKRLVKDKAKQKKILDAGLKGYYTYPVKNIKPFPGTVKLLEKLKKEGYRLYVVSHGLEKRQMKKIRLLKIKKYFDGIFIDNEVQNSFKEQYFRHIVEDEIENHKLKPEDIVSVGDRIDSEIMLCNKLGLTTVQMVSGRYSKMKPKNKFEKADFRIRHLMELQAVLESLS